MFQIGVIQIGFPTATSRSFVCGHHFEMTSNGAKKRWVSEGLCPMCWASRPTVHVKFIRMSSEHSQGYDWFPGTVVETWGSSAQGFSSSPDHVEAIRARVDAIVRQHHLVTNSFPGLDLDDPETVQHAQGAVADLQALSIHLWVGGRHATRLGLREGWYDNRREA